MEIIVIALRMIYSTKLIAQYDPPITGYQIGLGIGMVLMVLNYFRYKGKYWKFSDIWRDQGTSLERLLRGWLVVVAIFLPIIILVLLGTVFGLQ